MSAGRPASGGDKSLPAEGPFGQEQGLTPTRDGMAR
jgi:hypothetical protein